jgi:transforming growth factor-beta-induced protein
VGDGLDVGTDFATVLDVVANQSDLTILTEATILAGYYFDTFLCTDCNYTVFAPTDTAFAALDSELLTKLLTPPWQAHLTGLLANHFTTPDFGAVLAADLVDNTSVPMLSMENVTLTNEQGIVALIAAGSPNASRIVTSDLQAANGVVHTVDSVLLPPFVSTSLFGLANTSVGRNFTILYQLFEAIGAEVLLGAIGESGVTVFAPTDAAFEALGNETLANLTSDVDTLTKILSNHVVVGVMPAYSIVDGQVNASLGGLELAFAFGPASLIVNNASVVMYDVLANNGIVHAVDKVLMSTSDTPPSPSPPKKDPAPVSVSEPAPTPGGVKPPTGSASSSAAATVPIWMVTWAAVAFVGLV